MPRAALRSRPAARAGALAVLLVTATLGCGSTAGTDAGAPANSVAPSTQERVGTTDLGADAPAKKVFKPDQTDIAVLVGEKFAVRLPEEPTAGGGWKVLSAPDERLVKPDGDTFKAEAPEAGSSAGSAGQHEYKYKARAPGTTTVTFGGCAACAAGAGGAERIRFTITIS